MICKQCQTDGEKSTIQVGVGTTTLLYCAPYFDEDGKYHNHDSNISTSNYTCSNGHKFSKSTSGSCWCGWGDVGPDGVEYGG